MSPRRPASRAAFTLVEVMLAAVVMALALVGMIQVIVSGSEMLDVARKQTIAMQVIHGQIEQIKLRSWSEISALPATRTVWVDGSDHGGSQSWNINASFIFGNNLPKLAQKFQCTRTVTSVKTDLKEITFTVTWTGNTGRTHTRKGTTYYGKNGLYVSYQRS